MANKKHTRSSKRPLFIALLVFMLMMTIVFAFVGCNTRNKAEEQDNEQIDEIPEEEDPPLDEEEKEEDKKDEPKPEEEKKEEVAKPVSPPVAPKPSTPTVKPTAPSTPSKPVTPPANTAKYGSITIKKDGRYSETKTYDNVTIKADKVRLLNKTIKGDLIIDKSVDDDAVITLDNVEVMGEIIINGGYDFKLYNVEADLLKVKKKSGKVRLSAFDKTEIKDTETYRSIYLKEDDLSKGYDGFVNLTTKESNNIYIEVESFNCDLEGLYCNDITKVKGLDDSIYIDTVKAYDRVDLGSRVRVKTFTAYESGCTYVIEPNKIYTKGGAEEPERYKSKDKGGSSSGGKTNTPSISKPDVALSYNADTDIITASWPAVTHAVKYKVSYSIDSGSTWYAYTETTATSHNISSITDKNSFRIKVLAIDSSGNESSAGGTSSAISEKLATPTNVKVEFSAGVPTISWSAVSGTSNYSVTYTIVGSTTSSVDVNNATSYTLPKVADLTTVKAQVKAIGNGSSYLDSEYGNAESTWTPTKTKLDTPSAPPTITSIKSADGMSITATIVHTNTGGTYVVEYSTDGGASYTEGSAITNPITKPCTITARVKQKGDGITTLDSDYITSAVTEITQVAVPPPNITIDEAGVITITPDNTTQYIVSYGIDDSNAPTVYDSSNKPTATAGQTVYAKIVDKGATNTELGNTSTNSISVEKLATPSGALNASGNTLSWNNIDGATSYDVTIGSETSTKTVTTNSIDLTSYVGQQINPIDVIAKAVGKLDSDKGTLTHTQTELKTPTPTGATYSGTTLTLTFDANVLDTTNANYTVGVTDASSSTMLVSSPVTVSGDTITSPVTTNETNTLPDGTYNVTVTATANNISVYTSNGSKTITETYKLILPTAP